MCNLQERNLEKKCTSECNKLCQRRYCAYSSHRQESTMALTLYLSNKKELGFRVLEVIKKTFPDHEIEICSSIFHLLEGLPETVVDIGLAVLCISERAELTELVFWERLSGGLRVVLVLPDDRPDLLEDAYILHPAFIISEERDFMFLERIFKKVLCLCEKTHRMQLAT